MDDINMDFEADILTSFQLPQGRTHGCAHGSETHQLEQAAKIKRNNLARRNASSVFPEVHFQPS